MVKLCVACSAQDVVQTFMVKLVSLVELGVEVQVKTPVVLPKVTPEGSVPLVMV
jgi:hypothetical protein